MRINENKMRIQIILKFFKKVYHIFYNIFYIIFIAETKGENMARYMLFRPETRFVEVYEERPIGMDDEFICSFNEGHPEFDKECERAGMIPSFVKYSISQFGEK